MLDASPALLLSGLVLSAVGMFLFLHAKRAGDPAGAIGGLVMTLLPLGLHSLAMLWLIEAGVFGGVVLVRRLWRGGAV